MTKKVMISAEVHEQEIRNVTLEALTLARKLANGGSVQTILLGNYTDENIQTLENYGSEKIFVSADEQLLNYNNELYSRYVAEVTKQENPDILLIGHTANGKDFAPRVAARLQTGLITDCIDAELEGEEIILTRPLYAGKALAKRKFKDEFVFATLRPNNFATEALSEATTAEIVTFDIELPDIRTILKEVVQSSGGGADLTEAKVIVAGGREVRSAEGCNQLYDLDDALGGAVGASRGACDQAYCDYSLQIGQTGKVVTRDVYIACGISGAIQHIAGMASSKVIIAINEAPEAPIFKVADYGIVGDLFELVPQLTEKVKEMVK